MAINKSYLYNTLLVVMLTASVGTLIWGAILLINGKSGGEYVRVGVIMTFLSTLWLIVSNLKKK